jgi:hypothetical protein
MQPVNCTKWISADTWTLIHKEILRQCDALDGVRCGNDRSDQPDRCSEPLVDPRWLSPRSKGLQVSLLSCSGDQRLICPGQASGLNSSLADHLTTLQPACTSTKSKPSANSTPPTSTPRRTICRRLIILAVSLCGGRMGCRHLRLG